MFSFTPQVTDEYFITADSKSLFTDVKVTYLRLELKQFNSAHEQAVSNDTHFTWLYEMEHISFGCCCLLLDWCMQFGKTLSYK